jgi:glycosyltransferase involved in cell wall biosynthesis
MTITAYALSDRAAILRASRAEREWTGEIAAPDAHAAWQRASGMGWDLCCPYSFEATWNGGPHAADIEIRCEQAPAEASSFVRTQLGAGLLTFHTGYQMKSEAEHLLWVRGPINDPRDGAQALESIVDASVLPCTIVAHWQLTRPHQTIRFDAGEPFCTIVLYPREALAHGMPVVADAAASAHAFARLVEDPALQRVVQRLSVAQAETPSHDASVAGAQEEPPPSAHHTLPARGEEGIAPSAWATRLGDPPPVSCICPTYGRVELLEEAIQSFLLQDYPGRKELIVLNDYAQQTLACDHPEVHVINVPTRFRSIGEKYKAAAALASYDLIAVWHDDDVYLPHRLSYSVAHFSERRGFFKADRAWFWNDGQLSGPEYNLFHGGSCWSRALFVETQGYPHIDNGYDVLFEERCEEARTGATTAHRVQPEEVYQLYRWAGTGSYHLSAFGQSGHEGEQAAAHVRQQAARGQIRQGDIALNPHWRADYLALVRDCLRDGPATRREEEIPFPPPFFAIPGPEPLPDDAAARLFSRGRPVSISVILPALNESVLLRRTVEQFEATLPADGEIIVVDNGSIDGSADFLTARRRSRVSLIQSSKPLGVAGARNRGLAAARGEVVVFADAHIDIPPHWWQPLVTTLNRPRVGVVGPAIGVMGKPDYPAACGQRIAELNLRVEWLPWTQREPHAVPTLGGGFMAMRRETLEQAGAFDDGMPQWGSEDLEICVRYWLLGYEVWVVPEVTVLHYFRSANPLKLRSGIVTHNLLRVALLHFNAARIARVTGELQKVSDFGPALAHAVESDVWQRRAELAGRRVRDDDWLFQQFKESCPL